jgi:hypothetical protein
MGTFDPAAYGPAIAELLRPHRLPALAVDPPYLAMHAQLEALEKDEAFAPFSVRDRGMAAACRAGLWLLFDFLDEAHTISQDLHIPEGSYWHALVHRREPDYDNAKYWFRKVGKHPVYEPLRQQAATIAAKPPKAALFLSTQNTWDPNAFVDLCEAAQTDRISCGLLCQQIQRAEWDLLFDFCHRRATGRA